MLLHIEPGKPDPKQLQDLDATMEPLVAAAAAGRPLEPAMEAITRSFGFDTFVYGVTTVPHPQRDSRCYTWTTLPREWVALYNRNSYIEVDPRITQTWGRATPLVGDAATIRGDKKVREFLEQAARYGIRSGVSISWTDPTRGRAGIGFNSSISPVSDARRRTIANQLGMLMIFGARFHEMFMVDVVTRTFSGTAPTMQLSPREVQCLQMAAHGLTSADIAIKLGIAERTANFHFGNVLTKLDALKRQEAIAKGMKLGLIQMEL